MGLSAHRTTDELCDDLPDTTIAPLPRQAGAIARMPVDPMLAAAERGVEQRFLAGGECMVSLMGVVDGLVRSVEKLGGALDDATAASTATTMRDAITALSRRQQDRENRKRNITDLFNVCTGMTRQAASLTETMRYLRTFGMTAKITGAGLPEFTPFAVEIMEQIATGTREIQLFAQQLAELETDLKSAEAVNGRDKINHRQPDETRDTETFTLLTGHLNAGLDHMKAHNDQLAKATAAIGMRAARIRSAIGGGLTAMQIGDITRQRIEHVRVILARAADAEDLDTACLLQRLAEAQLTDLILCFERDSKLVISAIQDAARETREIVALRDQLLHGSDGAGDSFYQTLDNRIGEAAAAMAALEESEREGNLVADRTAHSAASLLEGINKVRAIKTDIFYMALNTNLRCSRLGQQGRAINVVTAELRVFAARLEETVDVMMGDLGLLQTAADSLSGTLVMGKSLFGEQLASARADIHAARSRTTGDLGMLFSAGETMFSEVQSGLSTLDFNRELGELLTACLPQVQDSARQHVPSADTEEKAAADLEFVAGLYTMETERAVHRGLFHTLGLPDASAPAASVTDDEDLFADALF